MPRIEGYTSNSTSFTVLGMRWARCNRRRSANVGERGEGWSHWSILACAIYPIIPRHQTARSLLP